MSADIFAVQPTPGKRRKVYDEWARVWPLLYSSDERCRNYPNPKRPTWRCKNAPVWLVQRVDRWGAVLCDPCYRSYGGHPA